MWVYLNYKQISFNYMCCVCCLLAINSFSSKRYADK
nr:MAG TPA: hypothetical protein [Caudoviricetes sp.]